MEKGKCKIEISGGLLARLYFAANENAKANYINMDDLQMFAIILEKHLKLMDAYKNTDAEPVMVVDYIVNDECSGIPRHENESDKDYKDRIKTIQDKVHLEYSQYCPMCGGTGQLIEKCKKLAGYYDDNEKKENDREEIKNKRSENKDFDDLCNQCMYRRIKWRGTRRNSEYYNYIFYYKKEVDKFDTISELFSNDYLNDIFGVKIDPTTFKSAVRAAITEMNNLPINYDAKRAERNEEADEIFKELSKKPLEDFMG